MIDISGRTMRARTRRLAVVAAVACFAALPQLTAHEPAKADGSIGAATRRHDASAAGRDHDHDRSSRAHGHRQPVRLAPARVVLDARAPRGEVVPGNTYRWPYSVTNTGSAPARNVAVTTRPNKHLKVMTTSPQCTWRKRAELVCRIGLVPGGETRKGTVAARVDKKAPAGERLTSPAGVSWQGRPEPGTARMMAFPPVTVSRPATTTATATNRVPATAVRTRTGLPCLPGLAAVLSVSSKIGSLGAPGCRPAHSAVTACREDCAAQCRGSCGSACATSCAAACPGSCAACPSTCTPPCTVTCRPPCTVTCTPTPRVAVTPKISVAPRTPVTPTVSVAPKTPVAPKTRVAPRTPVTPTVSVTPKTPVTPKTRVTPKTPMTPAVSVTPKTAVTTPTQGTPVTPTASVVPGKSVPAGSGTSIPNSPGKAAEIPNAVIPHRVRPIRPGAPARFHAPHGLRCVPGHGVDCHTRAGRPLPARPLPARPLPARPLPVRDAGDRLPHTGFSYGLLALAGLGLTGVGLVLYLVGRARRGQEG